MRTMLASIPKIGISQNCFKICSAAPGASASTQLYSDFDIAMIIIVDVLRRLHVVTSYSY